MITLGIIALFIGIVLIVWRHDRLSPLPYIIGALLVLFAIPLAWLSAFISVEAIPASFQKINGYSYVTETGVTIVFEDSLFKHDETYYTQEAGKAFFWIPFGNCEYVEIELPPSAVPLEKGASSNQYLVEG